MEKDTFSVPKNIDFIDLSIPLRFNGEQPNVYRVGAATSKPCEYGDFFGDTRRGGSVNFEEYTLIPHCNGTHTECVGHITAARISVRDCLKDVFLEAFLVTAKPENAIQSGETYPYELADEDEFITRKMLEIALEKNTSGPLSNDFPALIIRSLPNDESKLARRYFEAVPPFFSNEAMEFIVERGFRHLLVDLPSIDRLFDDGALSNHRIFWNVEPGVKETNAETRIDSTITELIYVPDGIIDGRYLLNLQIAPFDSDAAPSRPILINLL